MDFKSIVLQKLIEGYTQPQISVILKRKGVIPNSLSSIEKEINRLKLKHKAKTMCHLGAIITLKKYIVKKDDTGFDS